MPNGQTMGSRFIKIRKESGSENLRRCYSAGNGLNKWIFWGSLNARGVGARGGSSRLTSRVAATTVWALGQKRYNV